MPILLLLAFLAEDVFTLIAHALALVGLRLARRADHGRNVAHRLLVDAGSTGLTVEEWNELAKEQGITTKQRHYEIRMALKD